MQNIIIKLFMAACIMLQTAIVASEIFFQQAEKLIQEQQYQHAELMVAELLHTLPNPNAIDCFRIGNLFCSCGNLPQALSFLNNRLNSFRII